MSTRSSSNSCIGSTSRRGAEPHPRTNSRQLIAEIEANCARAEEIGHPKIVVALLAGQGPAPGSAVDGDMLELVDAKRIRLWGIYAPERAQTCQRAVRPRRCGDHATRALDLLIDDAR